MSSNVSRSLFVETRDNCLRKELGCSPESCEKVFYSVVDDGNDRVFNDTFIDHSLVDIIISVQKYTPLELKYFHRYEVNVFTRSQKIFVFHPFTRDSLGNFTSNHRSAIYYRNYSLRVERFDIPRL